MNRFSRPSTRAVSVAPLVAALLLATAFSADAQYSSDSGDKGRSSGSSNVDDSYNKGYSLESIRPQFRDADFHAVAPESGRLDTMWVQVPGIAAAQMAHRLHAAPADRFRLEAQGGPTVLRLKVCYATEGAKPRESSFGVLVTYDGRDIREFKTRARKYKSGTIDGSQRWISEWRTIDVPIEDGQHVLDVRAGEAQGVIAGIYLVPNHSASD